MKASSKELAGVLVVAGLLTIALPAAAGTFKPAPEKGVQDVYIVVLEDRVARKTKEAASGRPTVAELASLLGRAHGGTVQETWEDGLHGFVVRLPEARARKLAEDPRVKSVEQDFAISAPVTHCYDTAGNFGSFWNDPRPLPPSAPSTQTLDCDNPDPEADGNPPGNPRCRDNWGIDRIDQNSGRNELFTFANNGTGVHVYVLDTGVRWSHREFLNAAGTTTRVTGGVDASRIDGNGNPFPGNASNTNDCHGHGTHVTGIIAGRTFGIAKNAAIHPIYIFGCNNPAGSFVQAVVRGLNWMIADVVNNNRRPAIVNWSGGNTLQTAQNDAIRDVLQNAINANITVVQAAGNQSGAYSNANLNALTDSCSISFGGRVPDVIVAGGIDYYDGRWVRRTTSPDLEWCQGGDCGSNVGSCIDLWAPATHVLASNYTGDATTCQLSGTSMAAPHVTGAAAVYLQSNPNATPAQVDRALRSRGLWGQLNTDSNNGNYIGRDSDDVLVFSDTRTTGDTAPVASFNPVCPGRQCLLDATGSTDDNAGIAYLWRFPDGTTSTAATLRKTFAASSTNSVILRVTDSTGKTDHLLRTFTVNADAPPSASFTFTCTAATCTFDSGGSSDDGGVIASRTWNFGDGNTGSGTVVTHTYASSGTRTVTLTVTDPPGQVGQQQQAVTVTANPPPVANFTFTCALNACSFDGTWSSDDTGIASYAWSFGASTATANHTFANTGTLDHYTVTLTVTDTGGAQSSKSRRVSVSSEPVPAALRYFTINPCRLYDSRNATILTNGVLRVIAAAGNCGIPATAKALSVNVTAVSPTAAGRLALYPGDRDATWVGVNSIVNFEPANAPRGNSAIVQLATNGAGTLAINAAVSGSPGQVHAILDVDGYFSTDTTAAAGATGPLGFQHVPACRFADTRNSTALSSGVTRTFTAAGVCGVPAGASARSLHVGIPAPAAGGHVAAFPSNIAAPATSSINFNGGIEHLRNGARVRLAPAAPDFAARFTGAAGTTAHAYFDVHGYFKSDAPLQYRAITPCRAFDTGDANAGAPRIAADVPRNVQIQGQCGVPAGAKAAVVRVVVSTPTSSGDLLLYPSNIAQPTVSTVKFTANEPGLSMGTTVPLSTLANDLTVHARQMTVGGTVSVSVDVLGYFQ